MIQLKMTERTQQEPIQILITNRTYRLSFLLDSHQHLWLISNLKTAKAIEKLNFTTSKVADPAYSPVASAYRDMSSTHAFPTRKRSFTHE